MTIRVEQAKGNKDRYTILSSRLLEELRMYWSIDRLVIQQGIFLFPGDISKPFDDNLGIKEYSSKSKDNLLKFKIKLDVKERNKIFLLLHRMNINRATLFPSLAGFAESLKIKLAFHETLDK